jgi:zinc protease
LHPLDHLEPGVFAVEREVVRNELFQRGEMQLTGEVFQALYGMLFEAGHPYARPVIGTNESLSAITIDDAKSFAEKYYRPLA